MQVVDVSSLLQGDQNFDDIIRSAYIVQETRRTTDTLFFINKKALSSRQFNEVEEKLKSRGITPFVSDLALYHFIDNIQKNYDDNIELISEDYLAISRADSKTFIWDISNLKRFSTKNFSDQLLQFPHSRLGLYALLIQDSYHNINTGVEISPSNAITLVQQNKSLKDLLDNKNIAINLSPLVLALRPKLSEIVNQLKIQKEQISFEDYFSNITLSASEMRQTKGQVITNSENSSSYHLLENKLEIVSLINRINEDDEKRIVIDLGETYIGIRSGHDNYIAQVNDSLSLAEIYNTLSVVLENESIEKVCFSAKHTHKQGLKKNLAIMGIRSDIELAEFTLNNLSKQQTLDDLMMQYFFEQTPQLKGLEDIANKLSSISRLNEKLTDLLVKDGSYSHFAKVEMPMAKVLAHLEHNGVYANSSKLLQLSGQINTLLEQEMEYIRIYSHSMININAPKDVATFLFDTLKLRHSSRSTSEDNLLKILEDTKHPAITSILNARRLFKLNSTFAMKLPQKINADTNRIHATYNQNRVKTGRLSCEDPNLQNIPAKTDLGKEIRKSFEALLGRKIIAADYSQVELKILAHLANDDVLIEAFKNGKDIHQSTAAIVFKKTYEEVTAEERKASKAINFGIIYGMTKYGLAHKLGVTPDTAETFINKYFEGLPKTAKYIQSVKSEALEKGYVRTITGRKVYIENIHSDNPKLQASALRSASNAPMQGSAADIIKLAMVKINHALIKNKLDAVITMQVHDEIVIESKHSDTFRVAQIVKDCMENAANLLVNLDVEVGIGDNWEESHPIALHKAPILDEQELAI